MELEKYALLIAEHATDSMVFTDPEGLTVWVNKPFTEMTGYELPEMIGKTPGSILQGPDTDPATVAQIRAALNARRTVRTEILNYSKDGTEYWIDLAITPVINKNGKLTHFLSIERDITASKDLIRQVEASLREERERRRERKFLSQMSEWLFSARTMEELQDVVTRSMSRLFPGTDGALFIYSNSRDALDRVNFWGNPKGDEHIQADQCWGLRRGRAYSFGTTEIDLVCIHAASEAHPYFCLPIIAHGDMLGLMHIVFPDDVVDPNRPDVLLQRLTSALEVAQICAEQISLAAASVRLHAELQNKSIKDSLTGLWNRRWFLDMVAREIRRAETKSTPLSLAMIDADHFKKFNDAHGHDAGDTVLKVLGAQLMGLDGPGLFPCRIGGEEFAVIFSGMDAAAAKSIVNDIRIQLSQGPILYMGSALPQVTISVGIAELCPGEGLESLMKRADAALYSAKDAGRDRTAIAEMISNSCCTFETRAKSARNDRRRTSHNSSSRGPHHRGDTRADSPS